MPHFDLTQAEATMRAEIASTRVEGARIAAEHPEQADFISCQRYFDEAKIQFSLAMMKASNHGVERDVYLSAAAVGLAAIYVNLIESCIGSRERNMVSQWVGNAANHALTNTDRAARRATFTPEDGGHA